MDEPRRMHIGVTQQYQGGKRIEEGTCAASRSRARDRHVRRLRYGQREQ